MKSLSELDEATSSTGTDAVANGDTASRHEDVFQCEIYCDKCKDGNVKAVCYCADCDKKLCSRHEQVGVTVVWKPLRRGFCFATMLGVVWDVDQM